MASGSAMPADKGPQGSEWVMSTYSRFPITLVKGSGSTVWDEAGKSYLDFAGGLGVTAIGHSHPVWSAAVRDQLDQLDMVTNLFHTLPQAALAERLGQLLPIPDARTFFCNSGAEAIEGALKLVRKWGLSHGRTKMVALEGSFHGRTTGALAATGQPTKRQAFEPLVDWLRFATPNDLDSLDAVIGPDVAAVLLEPVLGEGGVLPLDVEFLCRIRELCDRHDILLIADEVQSGIGRCGDWLAISDSGVVPDVVTLAKALGGGLPIGAVVSRKEVAFSPGDHASTFGGGPIVCAGALAVLDVIEDEGLLARSRAIGDALMGKIEAAGHPAVKSVRGRGCLMGVELGQPVAGAVIDRMIADGVLASSAGPAVVRMSPPLVSTDEEASRAAQVFLAALEATWAQGGAA